VSYPHDISVNAQLMKFLGKYRHEGLIRYGLCSGFGILLRDSVDSVCLRPGRHRGLSDSAPIAADCGHGLPARIVRREKNRSRGRGMRVLRLMTGSWSFAGLVALSVAQPAAGDEASATDSDIGDLPTENQEILAAIDESPFEQPIHLESEETERAVHGYIHAIVNEPFERIAGRLRKPSDWCEILFLHLNVKACTHASAGNVAELTVYLGRKHYQVPDEAERADLQFRIVARDDDRLDVDLQADRGPYGTREFHMAIEAVPLDEDRSLLQFSYSVSYGVLGWFAMRVYLATAGRDRVGFTVERMDEDGEPVYIRGLRGMIERNTVRFYLALQAYLEEPDPDRLEARLARWFDLTERHPEQLREFDKDTYISQKLRERENQEQLQREVEREGNAANRDDPNPAQLSLESPSCREALTSTLSRYSHERSAPDH